MPELPEVQTTVNGLNRTAKGQIISDVWTNYASKFHAGKDNIKDADFFKAFRKDLIGAKIIKASRRAKNILIHLSNGKTILIHMKMTGHIMYGAYSIKKDANPKDPWTADTEGALQDPFNRFIRLVFSFENGKSLALSDMRRFAKVTLLDSKELENTEHLDGIGPEPLDESFTLPIFKARILRKPKGRVKTVLMDQSVIAGVGNIYSDETLWRAGIHPEERVEDIDDAKLKILYSSTLEVLKRGIDFGGDSMSDYRNIDGERGEFQEKHEAYRRTGKPCRKKGCTGIIQRKVVGGRSAHFCSLHQKLSGAKVSSSKLKAKHSK